MAKKTNDAVTKILKGRPFHEQPKRFDDGGSAYSSYDSGGGNLDYITPSATYMTGDNSGVPTAADIAGLTSGATSDIPSQINSEIASDPANLNPSGGASTGSSSSGSSGSGALSSLLKALGLGGGQGASSASGLAALAGLLGAAGQYKQNSALAPKFAPPAMFGGAPGTSAPSSGAPTSNGGYGPPGGYNYSNYANATPGTPGLGYAPRTAVNPNIPNYYTYGQQPQATFFSSGTPTVGTPPTSQIGAVSQGPAAMKRGGHVKKFMIGGFAGPMPKPPMSGAPGGLPPQSGATPASSQTGLLPGTAGVSTPMSRMDAASMGPPQPVTGMVPHPPMGLPPQGRPMLSQGMPRPGMPPNPVPHPVMGPQPVMGTRPVMRAGGGSLSLPPQSGTSGLPPQSSRHVQGPGDGTSDDIPARLGTGEYVMDAQTVSMAGNGDNGAGAKAFDKMRENIRKHKGASLAKGKMAPDAKDLHKYMGKS